MKVRGERDRSASQLQGGLMKAMIGQQGQIGAAKIRAGSQQAQMLKTIPDMTRAGIIDSIAKRFGDDPLAQTKAAQIFMHLFSGESGPDQSGGLPGMPGGGR
jgi:hypothetical protein